MKFIAPVSVAAGAWLLSACTAVLGMERAELERDGGSGAGGSSSGGSSGSGAGQSGSGGSNIATGACDTPDPACTECLSGLPSCGLNECLASTECRKAINRHMNCLAPDTCQELAPGSCTSHFGTAAGAGNLADCLSNACADVCTGVQTLASTCDLYCKCMEQKCSDFLLPADCSSECAAVGNVNDLYCRWQHCEVAAPEKQQHCQHALGQLGYCPLSGGKTCPDKTASGLTCTQASDCCSGKCQADICVD